ncbi:MAG: NAD(P)-binding domain-containing protein [Clostridiales Family XIII bacterium]|jgi:pyrroline-5-carboxylate reductase|nr:NAD(P)-binding domain-containing protein [Clostridiales Family XIII bacterium]
MLNKKIMFVGGGLMAGGIIRAMALKQAINPSDMLVYEIVPERMKKLEEDYGVTAVGSIAEGVAQADVVLLALKPQIALSVAEEVKAHRKPGSFLFSICAGLTIETLSEAYGGDMPIVRTMPHGFSQVMQGVTGVCFGATCDDEVRQVSRSIIESFGSALEISEGQMDIFTGFCAVGALWVMHMVLPLRYGACEAGLTLEEAMDLALENLAGTVDLVKASGEHPRVVCDRILEPGGPAVRALNSLEKNGYYAAVVRNVKAGCDRATALS